MDVVLLSRLQFSLTIMFHYLFPPLTIGMGIVLVYLGARYLQTRDPLYRSAQRFWTSIFALNFAIGVASGIVMEFQFGTNWADYSRFVGDVFGAALAAEGIFAFFLESGFLAVLVFGWDKVGVKFHFFATCMVALGSIFSAVWILVANSWQQTPAGSHLVPVMRDGQPWVLDGSVVMRAEVLDFWQVVFNPSTTHRLVHVLLGCFIMGAFFILSISAYYILKRRHEPFARRSFNGALGLAAVSSLAILLSGHFQAENVYEHQPAKMAAFEGHYETGPADLSLFAIPIPSENRLAWNLAVPGGLSMLLYQDPDAPVLGLLDFHPDDRPPVTIPFATYHLMVAIGMAFIALTLAACFWLWRGTLYEKRWVMWLFVLSVVPAVLANQAGWAAAEVGRQPWIVHPAVQRDDAGKPVYENGYIQYETVTAPDGNVMVAGMRTSEGVSRALSAQQVLGSIIMFGFIYVLLGLIWVFVLNHKIHVGPEPVPEARPEGGRGFFAAAAERVGHDESMTEAKEPPNPTETDRTRPHENRDD